MVTRTQDFNSILPLFFELCTVASFFFEKKPLFTTILLKANNSVNSAHKRMFLPFHNCPSYYQSFANLPPLCYKSLEYKYDLNSAINLKINYC